MNRRESLRLLALAATPALSAAPLAAGAAALATARSTSSTPAERLERFIRLRSAPGHAPVLWITGGMLMLKPEDEVARPAMRVAAVTLTQVIPREPGVYDWRLEEIGYFLDLDSQAVLDQWVNPWTGVSLPPRHYRTPEQMVIRASGAMPRVAPAGDIEFRGEITDLFTVGPRLTMTEDLYVSVPATTGEAARPARRLASLGTFTVDAAQLAGPASRWIDCEFTYATMNSFAPWLGMGARAGVQNMRLVGSKFPATRFDALPHWLHARIAAQHADFFDLPKRWTARD